MLPSHHESSMTNKAVQAAPWDRDLAVTLVAVASQCSCSGDCWWLPIKSPVSLSAVSPLRSAAASLGRTMPPFSGRGGDLGAADVHDSETHHPRSQEQRSAVGARFTSELHTSHVTSHSWGMSRVNEYESRHWASKMINLKLFRQFFFYLTNTNNNNDNWLDS